jgi:hypothetical protein
MRGTIKILGKTLSTGGDHLVLDNGEIGGVHWHAHFVKKAPVNQIPCAKSFMAEDSEEVQQEEPMGQRSEDKTCCGASQVCTITSAA